MKKRFYIILLSFCMLLLASCADFLNVNDDPDTLSTSTVDKVLPSGIFNSMYTLSTQFMPLHAVWVQHWTSKPNAPDYRSIEKYNLTSGDYDGAGWTSIYINGLMDLEWTRTTALNDGDYEYYLMATVMQCYVYQIVTDLWGDIPYSEALQGVAPAYDSSEDIYRNMIERMNEAITMYEEAQDKGMEADGTSDIIFEGDINKWIGFANSLKLKMYLRFVNTDETFASDGIATLEDQPFLTEDATLDIFLDAQSSYNFMYNKEWQGRNNVNLGGCQSSVDFLRVPYKIESYGSGDTTIFNNQIDPRTEFLFVPGKLTSVNDGYTGLMAGDVKSEKTYEDLDIEVDDANQVASPNYPSAMPLYLMTKDEMLFLKAEAALRYGAFSLEGTDQELYESAVTQNCARLNSMRELLGVDDPIDLQYIEVLMESGWGYYLDDNNTFEHKLDNIITQKWVAQINVNPTEAYFDFLRTGYPVHLINPRGAVLSYFPRRLLYVSSERDKNTNSPEQLFFDVPLWWQKN